MLRSIVSLGLAVLAAGVLAAGAGADPVYQTERLELRGVGGAPGGGMVVNIHANGPQVYAHEVYMLRQAVPGTYLVQLHVFANANCTSPLLAVPTATLVTNATGNGKAAFKFTPEDVAPFRGMTFGISWSVTGPATYVSDCTVVTLD